MALTMDLSLARRLERAEAAVGASFVAVRQRLSPAAGATLREIAGTQAIFDGTDSPFTQSFGLGLFAPTTAATLAEIDAFFTERGAPAMHEVSPLAGVETFALLVDAGHRPVELGTVLVQELAEATTAPPASSLRVRVVAAADRARWIEAAVAGWSDDAATAGVIRGVAETAIENHAMWHFLVERDGAAIATASLGIHADVAYLAGASTIPAARGAGAQAALLAARLDEARRHGCELAMMVATPGSTSQRNAERRGFRVAYSRTKWRRA